MAWLSASCGLLRVDLERLKANGWSCAQPVCAVRSVGGLNASGYSAYVGAGRGSGSCQRQRSSKTWGEDHLIRATLGQREPDPLNCDSYDGSDLEHLRPIVSQRVCASGVFFSP